MHPEEMIARNTANQTKLVRKDRSLESSCPDKQQQPGWLTEQRQAGARAGLLPLGKRESQGLHCQVPVGQSGL